MRAYSFLLSRAPNDLPASEWLKRMNKKKDSYFKWRLSSLSTPLHHHHHHYAYGDFYSHSHLFALYSSRSFPSFCCLVFTIIIACLLSMTTMIFFSAIYCYSFLFSFHRCCGRIPAHVYTLFLDHHQFRRLPEFGMKLLK